MVGDSVRGRLFRVGGATLFLGPCAAARVGRGVVGRVGVGAGGALLGCGEGTARYVVDSGVGVKEAGVGAGEGESISISFPFLDLDFSFTVLAGFSGRATGFLLRGRGVGVWSLSVRSSIFPILVARSAMWRLCLSWSALWGQFQDYLKRFPYQNPSYTFYHVVISCYRCI